YSGLLRKGKTMLDLHDLSSGAAWLATRWWLSEILPLVQRDSGGTKAPPYIIVTGIGRSRPSWQTSNIQSFVMEMLRNEGIPVWVQEANRGRLQLDLS
ncbi:unnamed protein product, partial [Symbiodinium pilosum]